MKKGTALLVIAACLAPSTASAQLPRAIADSAWARGDRSTARSNYLAGLGSNENDALALFRLALLAGWEGDHALSVAYLDRLIALHPQDRDARTARARSIAALGDLAGAIAAIDSILVAHPTDGGAIEARARFAAWQRDLALSEQLWRRALELDEHSMSARVGLSQVLRWQGRGLEARAVIHPSVLLSSDPDVRDEADRVESPFRPRVRSAVSVEDDSDGNRITTATAGGAVRLTDHIDMRGDGYYRSTTLDASAGDVSARGANISAIVEPPSGWVVAASAGASTTSIAGSPARPAFSATVTTPRRHPTVLTVTGSRANIDYTLPIVHNDVSVTEARASLDTRAGRDWNVGLQASVATFDVRSADESSRRLSGSATLRRRLSDALALVISARTFGFDRDLNGGYFDPDFYGLADAGLAWHRESRSWIFDVEMAPGLQKIGQGGAISDAFRAMAGSTWSLRPGRQLTARAVFANTGMQQLSADAGTGYRYASFSLTASWWF